MKMKQIIRWTAIPAVLLLAPGCATKGFVRSQVGEWRGDLTNVDSRLQSEDQKNAALTASALARADSAYTKAGGAWAAALGQVGLREVSRSQVRFAFDSSTLSPEAQSILGGVATSIARNPGYAVQIFGFTDPTGPDAYNLELGRRRAESVERFLLAGGPSMLSRFQTLSFGEEVPAAEAAAIGAGKDRRQVLLVLIERTPLEGKPREGIASR